MLFTLAILPSIALLIYIYKMDRVEKEPKKLLGKLFIWGIILIIPVIIVENVIDAIIIPFTTEGSVMYAICEGFLVAAFTEEVGKYIVLKKKTWKSEHFNCMFDGIVYAVVVSLGFASIENIAYVMDGGFATAFIRMFSSVPGHTCDAVVMGYFYSRAKLCSHSGNEELSKKFRRKAVLIPIILHGIYDCLIMMDSEVAGDGITILAILAWLVFVVVLFVKVFKLVKSASLNDEYIVYPVLEAINEERRFNMSEVMLTKSNFDEEVLKSDIPVLVDFYADWCGPCKSLAPVIEEIAEEYAGKVKVCKVNIDNDGGLSDYYNVMSIPTLMMFKNGEQAGMIVGYRPKKDIINLF